MTTQEAIAYLNAHGESIERAPAKWQKRGFAYYAQAAQQMLTTADLLEYAHAERDIRA